MEPSQSDCLAKRLLEWQCLLRLLDLLRHRLDQLLKLPQLRGDYLKELLDLLELLLLLVLQLLQVLQLLVYDLEQLKDLLQRLRGVLTHTGRPARRNAHA